METIKFTKMHGCGNDYVYIDCMEQSPDRPEALAREMSDRHCGIGADGIILILPSSAADFRMRMFNADGSEGAMCGNATRCIGKYVFDRGLTDRTRITLETLSGVKYLTLFPGADGKIESVTVDMGEPSFDPARIPVKADSNLGVKAGLSDGRTMELTAVSMGNPHGVAFTSDRCFPTVRISSSHRLRGRPTYVCVCGSAARARRWPAAPEPAPQPWRQLLPAGPGVM